MNLISKPCLTAFRAAAAILLLAGQPAQAAGGKPEKFNPADWKDWKTLSSSKMFDGAQGAAWNEMFLGDLAKARQALHAPGTPENFGQKQIDEAARVNKDFAADVLARPHFRIWLDAVESGKFNDLLRSETGWPYYVTRKNPLPPAAFPVIYTNFDLPGGRKLGVAVLNSGPYEVPDPASRIGSDARCWAGNGAGAGDEIMQCPAKVYLVEPDGAVRQTVDFVACFVEFGDTSGGSPERDMIRASFDARRGQLAVQTVVDHKPIIKGGATECGPVIVDVPFAKE